MAAEGHLLDDLSDLAIDNVESAIGFVTDIDAGTVGSEINSVRALDPFDLLRHFVGRWIDDVHTVSGGVGDINADHAFGSRHSIDNEQ